MTESAVIVAAVVFLLLYGALCLASLARYVLYSLGLMGLGNRLGVKNAWLAWIPVANTYVLGSSADKLEEKRGLSHKWGKLLLILNIVIVALVFLAYLGLIAFAVFMGIAEASMDYAVAEEYFPVGPFVALYLFLVLAMFAMSVVQFLTFVCIYKIFEEIEPKKSIKYFLIYLMVPFGDVYCLFKCKNLIPEPVVSVAAPAGDPAFGYDIPDIQQENSVNREEKNYDQGNQQ